MGADVSVIIPQVLRKDYAWFAAESIIPEAFKDADIRLMTVHSDQTLSGEPWPDSDTGISISTLKTRAEKALAECDDPETKQFVGGFVELVAQQVERRGFVQVEASW